MPYTSCIQHPKRVPFTVIRSEYVAISQDATGSADPNCTAAILNEFEYWTNSKMSHDDYNGGEVWIYKSANELADSLFNVFGINKVRASLEFLVNAGYLSRRNNPNKGWDRTYQYLLNVDPVQNAVNQWVSEREQKRESKPPISRNQQLHSLELTNASVKTNEAIPEITTENTNDDGIALTPVQGLILFTLLTSQNDESSSTPLQETKPTQETLPVKDRLDFTTLPLQEELPPDAMDGLDDFAFPGAVRAYKTHVSPWGDHRSLEVIRDYAREFGEDVMCELLEIIGDVGGANRRNVDQVMAFYRQKPDIKAAKGARDITVENADGKYRVPYFLTAFKNYDPQPDADTSANSRWVKVDDTEATPA